MKTLNNIKFNTIAKTPIVIAVTQIDVSAKTGDKNKFVKFWLAVYEVVKLPPKYLNKSKFAKMLYFNQFAPFDTNVKIRFKMYIPEEMQTAAIYDLNIVEIDIANNANIHIFIIRHARYIKNTTQIGNVNVTEALKVIIIVGKEIPYKMQPVINETTTQTKTNMKAKNIVANILAIIILFLLNGLMAKSLIVPSLL